MEIDSVLLQQVEELSCGETVHLHANLSGAYRFSIDEFQRTGDEAYRLIAGSTFGTAHLARQTASKTRVADQVGIGYFSHPIRQGARIVEKQNRLHPKRVTKGNNFSARTALNCTFKRIGEPPAEPLFKPFSE